MAQRRTVLIQQQVALHYCKLFFPWACQLQTSQENELHTKKEIVELFWGQYNATSKSFGNRISIANNENFNSPW